MKKSDVKGVTFNKGSWVVRFNLTLPDGKKRMKHLGTFVTKRKAEEFGLKARKEYFPNEKTPYKVWGVMGNTYEYREDYAVVHIPREDGNNQEMLVDVADLERLIVLGRNINAAYSKFTDSYYATVTLNGKTTGVHKVLLNPPEGKLVDHIYHDTMDNRRKNLRIVSYSENSLNRKHRKDRFYTKEVGIKRTKYQLSHYKDGKVTYVGVYDTKLQVLRRIRKFRKNGNTK